MKKKTSTKKLLFMSLLLAWGVAVGCIDSMIPLPIPLPGARLGLSNVVILTSLLVFGNKEGLTLAVLKSLLLMLVTGNVVSMFYSMMGGLLSALAMIVAIRYIMPKISTIGVSLIGSSFHNLGQVLTGAFMISNLRIFAYLPFLLLLGIFTGIFVGLGARYVMEGLQNIGFEIKE